MGSTSVGSPQFIGCHPGDDAAVPRRAVRNQRRPPASTPSTVEDEVARAVKRVRREGDRLEIRLLNGYGELLVELAGESFFERLAGVHLAAGELPRGPRVVEGPSAAGAAHGPTSRGRRRDEEDLSLRSRRRRRSSRGGVVVLLAARGLLGGVRAAQRAPQGDTALISSLLHQM